MNTMLISIGLSTFIPPEPARKAPTHAGKSNAERKDDAYKKLVKALGDRIMSTRDIAYFMGVKRATAAKYLSNLRDEHDMVEVVGETIHAGDTSKQFVWRLK
jgi:DNA invertase Pin-like site-specific DNA recombinase